MFFGFFTLSASIGAAIAITQVIGAIGNAPGVLPLNDVATSLAIDLGAVALFAFLLRNDLKVSVFFLCLTRKDTLGTPIPLKRASDSRLHAGFSMKKSSVILWIVHMNMHASLNEGLTIADLLHVYILAACAQARDKQIARLTREERLGALQLGLANGKRIRVAQLRSFSRAVCIPDPAMVHLQCLSTYLTPKRCCMPQHCTILQCTIASQCWWEMAGRMRCCGCPPICDAGKVDCRSLLQAAPSR